MGHNIPKSPNIAPLTFPLSHSRSTENDRQAGRRTDGRGGRRAQPRSIARPTALAAVQALPRRNGWHRHRATASLHRVLRRPDGWQTAKFQPQRPDALVEYAQAAIFLIAIRRHPAALPSHAPSPPGPPVAAKRQRRGRPRLLRRRCGRHTAWQNGPARPRPRA